MSNGAATDDDEITQPSFDYAAAAAVELRTRLAYLLERTEQVAWRLPTVRPVDRRSALAGLAGIISEAEQSLASFRQIIER